jgi:HEAT repeat protein
MATSARTLVPLVAVAAVVGVAVWALLPSRPTPRADSPAYSGRDDPRAGGQAPQPAPSVPPVEPAMEPAVAPRAPVPVGRGGGVPPGLRKPSGEDLSDPARVKAALRAALGAEFVDWDRVTELLAVLDAPLDADVKTTLEDALVSRAGTPAGNQALLAFGRLRDASAAADLVARLDDASLSSAARANVLVALATMPGGDAGEIVRGISARMNGDADHDRPYARAIAKRGGPEAVRVVVERARAADAAGFVPEAWNDLDLARDPAAADALAEALKDASLSPASRAALVAVAGRPSSPALVAALVALDVEGADPALREQVRSSLARSGDEAAVGQLLADAKEPATAESAVRALSQVSAATTATRAKIVEAAREAREPAVRLAYAKSLGSLKEAAAVPVLTEWAGGADPEVARQSILALGRVGAKAVPALPTLASAFRAGDEATKINVAVALGEMGAPEAAEMLERLRAEEAPPSVKTTIERSLDRYK